eukprot:gene10678-11811_t
MGNTGILKLLCFLAGLATGLLIVVDLNSTNTCYSLLRKPFSSMKKAFQPHSSDNPSEKELSNFAYREGRHRNYNDSVARKLKKEVRILCWILTSPKTLHTKGKAVRDTWGKRCNKLIFMSSKDDPSYPAINLNVTEGRENLWDKTRAAFKYIYQHHMKDADWFLKADDDSFVIVENLRYFLSKYKPTDPHFFGRWFTPFGGYNSGGAGYVLSKKSVRQFMRAMNNPWKCPLKYFAEDVAMGNCLAIYGTHPGDTRDSIGRQTFHPYALEYHFIPGYIGANDWLHQYDKYPVEIGPKCCSDHSTTFHYVDINNMYVYDYFIHHLYPYGINHVPHH